MPFLMVSAVRAPTRMAPSNSKIVPKTMACLYEIDLEDTLVAQALATSSMKPLELGPRAFRQILTCSVVVGIEHGKERANHEHVGILVQHLGR